MNKDYSTTEDRLTGEPRKARINEIIELSTIGPPVIANKCPALVPASYENKPTGALDPIPLLPETLKPGTRNPEPGPPARNSELETRILLCNLCLSLEIPACK